MTMYTIPTGFLVCQFAHRYSSATAPGTPIWQGRLTHDLCEQRFPGKDKEKQLAARTATKCSLVARVYGRARRHDGAMEAAAAAAGTPLK